MAMDMATRSRAERRVTRKQRARIGRNSGGIAVGLLLSVAVLSLLLIVVGEVAVEASLSSIDILEGNLFVISPVILVSLLILLSPLLLLELSLFFESVARLFAIVLSK